MTEHDDTRHDEKVLTLVAESFDAVRMRRRTDAIVERGRAVRRRRRAAPVIAAAGVAAATALGVSLPPNGPPQAAGRASTAPQPVNVDLAGWSVHTNADSTVTVTMRQLRDPELLRQVLAKAGVRAVVGTCVSHESGLPQLANVLGGRPLRKVGDAFVLTIYPLRMPAGSWLVFAFVLERPGSPAVGAISIGLSAHEPSSCTYDEPLTKQTTPTK
jgi:hypothetical protein